MMWGKWHQGSDDSPIMSTAFSPNPGTCSPTSGLWTQTAHDVWARRMLIGPWCTGRCPQRQRERRWRRNMRHGLGVGCRCRSFKKDTWKLIINKWIRQKYKFIFYIWVIYGSLRLSLKGGKSWHFNYLTRFEHTSVKPANNIYLIQL